MIEQLKQGTTKCPQCKAHLHFHQLHGIRLYRETTMGNTNKPIKVYDARCQNCKKDYEIKK